MKINSYRFLIAGLIIAFLVLAGVPSVYFYQKYQKAKKESLAKLDPTKEIIEKVGMLMVLPEEKPTVANITDKEKLKGQTFFSLAENGDQVLIYSGAKKAILYRPSLNKIIEVAPINIESNTAASPTVSPTPTKTLLKIALYNGTKTVGLAKTMEADLKGRLKDIEVVAKKDAIDNYTKTIVIDLTGNQSDEAVNLAKTVAGEVGELPKKETRPQNADYLIIIGTDYVKK